MSVPPPAFVIEQGFPDSDRALVATLYWDAFGSKLGRALGPDHLALDFLECALDPAHALAARSASGTLIGIAGFKTPMGGLVAGGWQAMTRVYGLIGATWRTALLAALGSDVDNRRFLVDGLFVAPPMRGQGVGSALIDALAEEGMRRGYRELRLEVIEENIRARALYERKGFAAIGRHRIGVLALVFGFRAATTMVRPLFQDGGSYG